MLQRRAVLSLIASMCVLHACTGSGDSLAPRLADEAGLAKAPPGPSDPTAAFWFPTDDAALGIRSDHLYLSGTSSVYASGVCGVNSKIFATTAASNSGDAIMHTDNPKFSDRKCADYPRKLTVVYGPGDTEVSTAFINVRQIANTTYQIPLGATVLRTLNISAGRCGQLIWAAIKGDGTSTNGADNVNVTRTSANTWLVETQPYPDNEAYCNLTGQKYNLAVQFTVISSDPLP